MTEIKDIYWLAGILEGEGSFSVMRAKAHCAPHIQINMTDRDIIERVAAILKPRGKGVRTYSRSSSSFGSQSWSEMRLTGYRAVGWMMTLYPLMGIRRQRRIRELISQWRTSGGSGANHLEMSV